MYSLLPSELKVGQRWKDAFGNEVEIASIFPAEPHYFNGADKLARLKDINTGITITVVDGRYEAFRLIYPYYCLAKKEEDEQTPDVCIHKESEDGVFDWQASCGIFYDNCWNDADVEERGFNFCPYCGRRVVVRHV